MDDQPYNNQSLFSEYYLQELVRDDEFWQESLGQAQNGWEKLRDVYRKVAFRLAGANEAETERLFIRPVLDALGHLYALQPTVPSPEGPRRPDFAFFTTEEELREAERLFKGKVEFFKTSLAVGDAKHWDRSLDKKLRGAGDPFTNHNPSYQIDYYLRVTNCRWGILTNGRLWRLYNRDTSYRFDVFYEIDLPALLERDPFEADVFTYFFAFFRKGAFVRGPGEECFLDRAYRGSVEYAAKLGEELKENVYEALRLLAEGLVKYPPNYLSPDQDLDRIRENVFVLIYRILFTLYAEDRGLLPLAHPDYQSYSLKRLAREVAEKLDQHAPLAPTTLRYWPWLTDLFRIINEGDAYLGVPPYNGGLFNDEKHPFLNQYQVGDSYLAQVIDYLTRAKASGRVGRGLVSYRDLEIRHLGSIYEGLLEHRPRVAQEDIAVVKEGKAEKFVPVAEVGKRKALKTYRAGQVYLETDKGERKGTGSYYTPDYIVKYIVENTLGPIIEEKKKLAQALSEKREPEIKSLKRSIAALKAQATKAHTPFMKKQYEQKVRQQEHELETLSSKVDSSSLLIDEILKIKLLDPAMGSGHFLVEATDFLAAELVKALGAGPKEVDEDDKRWARREVVEKCIYGVDLNPLAVELAKLSLWLWTVAKNRPLNFLDHHFRCGNSLIGARIKDLARLPELKKKIVTAGGMPEQLGLFEQVFREKVHLLLKDFELIEQLPSETVEQINNKEEYYKDFRNRVRRFQDVSDLWTSLYFGNEVTWNDYRLLQEKLRAADTEWEELRRNPWFSKGVQLAEQKRFFHWELEFPEVFYEGAQVKENPGFDVVVGNPPYGLISDAGTKSLVQQTFVSAQYQADNYVTFMERAYRLTRQQGYQSLIVPTTFLAMHYFSAMRRFLLDRCRIVTLVHFKFPVFEDPTVESAIYVCQNEPDPDKRQRSTVTGIVVDQLEEFMSNRFDGQAISQARFEEIPENDFNIAIVAEGSIVLKLQQRDVQLLGEISDIFNGLKPYEKGQGTPPQTREMVKKRVYDATYKKDKTYCPYLMGRDINRYAIAPLEERWISYGEWLAAPRASTAFFTPQKILVRQTADSIIAGLDKEQFLHLNNIHNIHLRYEPPTYNYILAILNSRIITYFHQQVVPEADRVFAEVKIVDLERLPIRRIPFTTPEKERARLLQKGKTLYERCLAKNDQACVLGFVEDCLKHEPEQADVVHDLLTFLAEQMVEMNRQKHDEVKGFLEWLERESGAKVNDLKQKTKIRGYHEGTFEELIEALKENRKALAIDPSRKAFQDRLKIELETSLAKVQPLKERIALTDRLIDQVVYRLYGLTDEEIDIIEATFEKPSSRL